MTTPAAAAPRGRRRNSSRACRIERWSKVAPTAKKTHPSNQMPWNDLRSLVDLSVEHGAIGDQHAVSEVSVAMRNVATVATLRF